MSPVGKKRKRQPDNGPDVSDIHEFDSELDNLLPMPCLPFYGIFKRLNDIKIKKRSIIISNNLNNAF